MDINRILEKQKLYKDKRDTLHEVTINSYNDAFELEFTHNSTAIEGNTLTLLETKVVLEDGISIGGIYRTKKFLLAVPVLRHQQEMKCIPRSRISSQILHTRKPTIQSS